VGELLKGLGWMRALRRAGVRLVRGATALAIEGEERCRAISFAAKGRRQCIETDLVLLHQGVIPNLEITEALGCEHVWDEAQLAWRPRLGPWCETSVPTVAVAGDCGGIEGAAAAALTGRLAALGALSRLGALSAEERDRRALPVRAALGRALRTRALLDRLYRPDTSIRVPADDGVIVCRCEEVTAGELRRAARLGALGLSQAKAYTRAGMGPCQGRMCGPTAAALIAAVRGVSEAEVEPYRSRPPLKPVTVGALAQISGP
ncbi:MAG: (2Fe-2S)-binding protein, partial [Alphaproteobacteria bacterium]